MTIAGRHDTSDDDEVWLTSLVLPAQYLFAFVFIVTWIKQQELWAISLAIINIVYRHVHKFLALVKTAVNKFIKVIKDFFNPKKNCRSAAWRSDILADLKDSLIAVLFELTCI